MVCQDFFPAIPRRARRKAELRRLQAALSEQRPPYYRPKQNLVLPGFALAVYRFYSLLRPLAELARSTVANSDIRISQRYFDYLIDCRLPSGEQERKRFFVYDGMAERASASLKSDEELEAIEREFQAFLDSLDALGSRAVNADLFEVERFIDLCRHDYERIIGLFDPSANLDDQRYKPDFASVPGEQVLPELVDFYYLTESFVFSQQLKENVLRLLEKRQPDSFDAAKKGKIDKIFSQLGQELSERLDKEILLSLIRVIKDDPGYSPSTPRERKDFLEAYRRRLVNQFDKDRERMLREQHENAIAADIRSLFGDAEILEVDGYDEEHDSLLRRESPNGFTWIKPMRILKTFIADEFEPQLKESIKRDPRGGLLRQQGLPEQPSQHPLPMRALGGPHRRVRGAAARHRQGIPRGDEALHRGNAQGQGHRHLPQSPRRRDQRQGAGDRRGRDRPILDARRRARRPGLGFQALEPRPHHQYPRPRRRPKPRDTGPDTRGPGTHHDPRKDHAEFYPCKNPR